MKSSREIAEIAKRVARTQVGCPMAIMSPLMVANINFSHKQGLVVFAHGLTGDAGETWDGFMELVRTDPDLGPFRILGKPFSVLASRRGLLAWHC